MKDFTTYLSTAPVLAAVWFGVLAGVVNRQAYLECALEWVSKGHAEHVNPNY